MRKDPNTSHYRFNLSEEVWIIDNLIKIEMTRPITDSEEAAITKIKDVMLNNEQDPYAKVWEPVYQMFEKYQIGGCPKSIYITTNDIHYVGPGNGKYYKLSRPNSKGVVDFEGRKKKRQDKRNAVCEQAAKQYKDIPMGGDDMLAKIIRDYKNMKEKMEELANEVADLKGKTTEPDVEPYTKPILRIVNGGVSTKLHALREEVKNRALRGF